MRWLIMVLTAAGLAACVCGEAQLSGARGAMAVDPLALDFGVTAPHEPVIRQVRLKSQGPGPLALLEVAVGGDDAAQFAAAAAGQHLLEPGQALALEVVYAPQAVGEHHGWLELESDAEETPVLRLALKGRAELAGCVECPVDGGVPDGGVPDGGVPDGGVPDGGVPDGGAPDGGAPDGAGAPDGGATGTRCRPVSPGTNDPADWYWVLVDGGLVLRAHCQDPPRGLSCSDRDGCCHPGGVAINGRCVTYAREGEYCYATPACALPLHCSSSNVCVP